MMYETYYSERYIILKNNGYILKDRQTDKTVKFGVSLIRLCNYIKKKKISWKDIYKGALSHRDVKSIEDKLK